VEYRQAKLFIIEKLRGELSPRLHYHSLRHTLDVWRVAGQLCQREGVSRRDTVLVKTAALFHDAGFVHNRHIGHEHEGCLIAQAELPRFGYSEADIASICKMIMATKIPQSPTTLLEEILCDADLDYLGRTDFPVIGQTLFKELQAYQLIGDEQAWNRLQVGFLGGHRFHTRTNAREREPLKREHLIKLSNLIAQY
jgi:uncharacterized protein